MLCYSDGPWHSCHWIYRSELFLFLTLGNWAGAVKMRLWCFESGSILQSILLPLSRVQLCCPVTVCVAQLGSRAPCTPHCIHSPVSLVFSCKDRSLAGFLSIRMRSALINARLWQNVNEAAIASVRTSPGWFSCSSIVLTH